MSMLLPSSSGAHRDDANQAGLIFHLMESIKWGIKEGHLRHLDLALVRFFYGLETTLKDKELLALLWLLAVLSNYLAQGHACVSLKMILAKDTGLFQDTQVQRSDVLREHYGVVLEHLPQSVQAWKDCLLKSSMVRLVPFQSNVLSTTELSALSRDELPAERGQSIVLMEFESELLIYFRRQWMAEDFIANALFEKSKIAFPVDAMAVSQGLDLLFSEAPKAASELSIESKKALDWQKIACALSVRSPLSIITGGPGTGKTFTVARLIALACMVHKGESDLRISLAAPTGKAASRLYRSIESSLWALSQDLEGHLDCKALLARMGSAKTLHTLLGYRMHEKSFRFNEHHPLALDLLVLDEASMIDAELMCSLLKALPPKAQLILLGDKDQLSSVEVGSILSELSGERKPSHFINLSELYDPATVEFLCKVTALPIEEHVSTHVRRGRAFTNLVMLSKSRRFEGHIAELAQCVNAGDVGGVARVLTKSHGGDISSLTSAKMDPLMEVCLGVQAPVLRPGQSGDLFEGNKKPNFLAYLSVLQRQGALRQESRAPMLAPVESWMEEALIEFERFRVLCAINEGPLGSVAINQAIEAQLQKQGWIRPRGEWYSGRAIMLTRNQHDLGLSNGDVGLVVADPSSNAYRAYFLAGSGFQGVSINRLLSVQTAYAMSIHKSQGSEYEHALVVLQDHAEKSLTRELLYTGVTRAKRFLSVFQARSGLIEQSVSMRAKRTSGLSGRLQALSALDN